MDDVLSGADDEATAIKLRYELRALMDEANFSLRKWTSKRASILNGLTEEKQLRPLWVNFKTDGPLTALGIC